MSANFHPLVYIIDYILGIIMWTLVGRVAMNIFQREDSQFFFMRAFVNFTNPLLKIFKPLTPSFIVQPLVLGVWWKRANKEGAIAGMVLGLVSGFAYLVWVRSGGSGFLGITQLTFGIFGSTVSLVAMVVVSLMTSAPSAATQKMVDDSRVPAGASVIGGQK